MPFWLPLATTSRSCSGGSETFCACSPPCSWRLCRDPNRFPRHTLPEDLNAKTVATDNLLPATTKTAFFTVDSLRLSADKNDAYLWERRDLKSWRTSQLI